MADQIGGFLFYTATWLIESIKNEIIKKNENARI